MEILSYAQLLSELQLQGQPGEEMFLHILLEENFSKDIVHFPFLWMRCIRVSFVCSEHGSGTEWSSP